MTIQEKNNYLAVTTALLTTTMLSNNANEAFEKDSKLIVDFIGKSFGLSKKDQDELLNLITDELTVITTLEDVDIFFKSFDTNESLNNIDFLYLKSEALMRLKNIYDIFVDSPQNQFAFDYSFERPYYSSIRFKELETASIVGNVDINRTIAILLATGIGCEKNLDAAIYRLEQCALWGDVAALHLLVPLFEEKGQKENAKLYKDNIELSRFMLEGRTIVPENEVKQYDNDSKQLFNLISSIKQDIVLGLGKHNIDYSFIEVMLLDNLDYYKKMYCVNNYQQGEWKAITNSSDDPSKRIGFRVKED